MKQQNFWSLGLVLVVAAAVSRAYAADESVGFVGKTNQLTVDGMVQEALERNAEIKFYQAEIAAAKAGRKTAGQIGNPELSTSLGHKRVSSGSFAGEGVAWSVSVTQPFEWPGRLGLRKAIANRDVELAELGFDRFRTALAGRVRVLAYGVFAAEQKAAVAREV